MKLKKPGFASFFFGLKGQVGTAASPDKPDTINDQPSNADTSVSAPQDLQERPVDFQSGTVANRYIPPVITKPEIGEDADTGPQKTDPVEPNCSLAVPEPEIELSYHKIQVETRESTMAIEEYDEYDESHHINLNYGPLQLAQCERQIEEFMEICPDAYGAVISTVDGHEVVYKTKRDIPVHKISTMNSSLLALGETIARESQQKLCQFVILENSDGRVVSLRINNLLMLTCISSKEVNLGMLLNVGRNTAATLERILSD